MTLAQCVAKIPLEPGSDIRTAAGTAAIKAFGSSIVTELPVLVNIAALTQAMGKQPILYDLAPDALELIDYTDLRSVPAESPRLLKSACIIESAGLPLFSNITDLGIYPIENKIGIVGLSGRGADGGALFALWTPHWVPDDLSDPDISNHDLVGDIDGYETWAREAIRFLLIYAILLEAEKTPVLMQESKRKQNKKATRRERDLGRVGWTTRSISLTTREVRRENYTHTGTTIGNRIGADIRVSGHLKRQAYGPGRGERRWIYIEAYEARRWLSPGPRRLVVKR